MEDLKIFEYPSSFILESGKILPSLKIAYHTYGKLNKKGDNCIWVCHALTANSDVKDWWAHTVEPGGFLDPEKFFIVCANILGSCYGSTGPLTVNPESGQPWYSDFPAVTIRDMVRAHQLLSYHLGINRIFSLIGSSVGGFQAMEWAVETPHLFDNLVIIATSAKASPWTIALDETQRMAILCDPTFGEKNTEAGKMGLATARAIGMLSYRGAKGYNLSQQNIDHNPDTPWPSHRASSYQRYQGEKLAKRFDAYSYLSILNAFDTHDIGRQRGGVKNALSRLEMPTLVVGITSDIIFLPEEMRELADMIPHSVYKEIDSPFGHDGFLVEHKVLNAIIKEFHNKSSYT